MDTTCGLQPIYSLHIINIYGQDTSTTISIPRPPTRTPARTHVCVELLALAFEHARFIYSTRLHLCLSFEIQNKSNSIQRDKAACCFSGATTP